MKPRIILGLLMAVLILLPTLIFAQETKLGGEFWGRFTNETAKYKDANGKYVDKTSKNYFALDRGYLDLRTKFSESTSARFTVDIFSTDATYEYLQYSSTDQAMPIDSLSSSTKKSSVDGAGLKLKYAFVDFANLLPVPDMTLSAGLQKVYFGTIYDWDYTLIGKDPVDEYKLANSADYGLSLNGFLPQGYGEYALGIYNGEGYKKFGSNLKENTEFAYLGNIRFTPIAGVTLGGSYMVNTVEAEKALSGDTINKKYEEQNLMAGVLRLAYGPVDFWAEYLSKDVTFPNESSTSKDYTATGLMLMPIVKLKDYVGYDVQVIGRLDQWDESDNASNKNYLTAITGGLNYNFLHDESFVPKMQLQLNYTTKQYDEKKSAASFADGVKDTSTLMLQLKWRFSSTIK
ncbi:MAG: hypothetical protein PHI68_01170 [Candidatus Cloacimonetes bacterium]|nr:hypothetical protein [Candidatus Cloacimonadota bacterium]